MELPKNLVKSSIGRGDILHADVFADIDHGKFFVVMATVDNEVGIFMINSNINPFIQDRQEMLDMQFPLKPSDYSFLRYLSFMDVSSIKILDADILVEHLTTGRCKKVGHLSKSYYVCSDKRKRHIENG